MARKIKINDMTLNGMTVSVDVTQLNTLMDDIVDDVAHAMKNAIGKAMAQVKFKARDKLYAASSHTPQAKKVGHSLDFDHSVSVSGHEIDAEARFGSKGPSQHGGTLGGEGVHTSPDDTGGTYPIAAALEFGNPKGAHWFKWKGESGKGTAHIKGRQVGSAGGPSAWMPAKGGQSYTHGFSAMGYIASAEQDFRNRINGYVNRELKGRFS